ncbi:histone-lysine N-methyltransferase SETMAR [Trichonephila clavipes]|nr:histone-lysine N-methyltransferase SETMAR [Trichonephila clavipes]
MLSAPSCFLHGKCQRPADIHKEIVSVYGNIMNRQNRTEEAIRALGHYLGGKSFRNDDEIKDEVEMWFRQQAATFYDCGIQKLVHRLNKCLDNGGHGKKSALAEKRAHVMSSERVETGNNRFSPQTAGSGNGNETHALYSVNWRLFRYVLVTEPRFEAEKN